MPYPQNGCYEKDIKLIVDLGKHLGVTMPLGEKVMKTYQKATKIYGSEAPHLSVVRLIEEENQKELRNQYFFCNRLLLKV